jgi:hypothetical protein
MADISRGDAAGNESKFSLMPDALPASKRLLIAAGFDIRIWSERRLVV